MMESELIAGVRAGDLDAFTAVVETYQSAIYNLCCRMLGNAGEAEDVTQETFFRAYSQIHRYDSARPFKAWLFAIASHNCIDRLRKRRWHFQSIDEEPPAGGVALRAATPDPEQVALSHERRDEVAGLLAQLAPKDRTAIVLHYWYGLSYAEIAIVIGASVGAVKSRMHRARATLGRRMLAGVERSEAPGSLRPKHALAA